MCDNEKLTTKLWGMKNKTRWGFELWFMFLIKEID